MARTAPQYRFVLGTTVGNFTITSKVSEGGMGVVYRAEHALIGKAAAVKLLLPELSANQEIVTRFFNEAKAATAIRHPGIVEIFDFGYLPSGLAYLVMEFLDGEPLSRRLAHRGKLEEREALALIRGAASALAAAHDKGIVHRDLKPDNIFLVPDPDMPGGERPKLLDFGIAKLTDPKNTAGGASARTRTGAVMGTPTYMSPEQCRGAGEVDARSDIYSLGCILYEMLCGRPPFVAEGVGEIIGAHLFMPPEAASKYAPQLSDATVSLVMNLLSKRPEDRVQTAAELARLLGHGSLPPLVNQPHFAPTMALPSSPGGLANGTVPQTPGSIRAGGPVTMPLSPGQAGGDPTTLSGAARAVTGGVAEGANRPASRRALYAAIGVVAVAGVVIAVVLSSGSKPADPTTPTSAAAPTAPAPSATDAGLAGPAPAPDAAVKVAADVPPDAAVAAVKPDRPTSRPDKPKPKPRPVISKPKPKPDKLKPKPGVGPVPIETEL